MTVAELVTFLLTQDQTLPVVYSCCSEYALLETKLIKIDSACPPRADGWVADARPDKPTMTYLMLPGN